MYRSATKRPSGALAICLALGAGLVAPGSADAQTKNRKRATVTKLTTGGPTLQYEQFRQTIELKVAEKREEQLAGIKRLLDLGPAERDVPDLKFRMAELYYEKSRFFFFRGQETEDKAIRTDNPAEKERLQAEKEKHLKESNQWLQQALDVYVEIRDKFPKYERMPEVLFALGQSYWSQGRFQAAIEAYADLIRNFRDSPLVAEAWIAFGEFYFNEGDVNKALKSYEKAAEDKRSRVYGFALYKQAWCYYNLSEWQQALRKFKATVFYSQLADQLSGENKIALGREAQKDWVRTYVHVGDEKRAKFELADLLGVDECNTDACMKLLEQLADLWFDDGYFEESAYVFRQLIELSQGGTRTALFQGKVVDLVSRSGDKKRVVMETRRLVEIYQAVKAKVGEGAPAKQKSDVKDAEVLAETTMRKLAQIWNREAKKTRNNQTYEFAMTMYTDYLSLFSDTKYAYEMRFQLGDLYYKLEKFDDSAKAYEVTVAADPKGKYVVEAANDNILAVEEHLKDLGLKTPKASDTPVEVHPQKQRLIDACDRYVKLVPVEKADKLVAVKFKAAKIYYDYSHYDEAVRRFDEIVRAHAESDQAEYAANLVVDVYNLRKDWEKLYATAGEYARIDALVKDRAKLAADLARFGEYAKFALVQILEERVKTERGDLRLVAQAYEDFYTEFPKSDNADEALFNASVAWDKAGQKGRADALRKKLLEEYPTSPLGADVAYYVAKQYEARTQFELAANGFLDFATKHPEDPRARDALYNAAAFYAGIGAVKKATKLREDYLKKYGRAKEGEQEASAIYWAIAKDLDRAGRSRAAADRYRDYAKEFPNTPELWDALWREAQIRETQLRQGSAAEKIQRTILGTYKALVKKGKAVPDRAKRYASLVELSLIEPELAKYRKLRVETPNLRNPTPFQRSLAEKARGRERLIKAYTSIVTEYQQAESTVASLHNIAGLWDGFVQDLMKVPCPRGVSDEVCQLVKQGIEEQALPAREAAYQAYKVCVEKSNELNVFTEYSTKCVKKLEGLAPAAYPQIVERSLDFVPTGRLQSLSSNGLILEYDGYGVAKQAQASAGENKAEDL